MLIPTADRKKIYEHLFQDGVAIAKKDYFAKTHPEVPGVTNLVVIKALQSLASRGHVKQQFTWSHFYFYLTDSGVAYLRDYLGLEEEVIPNTHRQPQKTDIRSAYADKPHRQYGGPRPDTDHNAYRTDKTTEAGPGAAPVRGFGRGAPQ